MTVMMDRERIIELLTELGRRLQARGIRADIFIVGGSAMALAYDSRRSTSDIDAIIRPAAPVLEEARAMARDLGLEPNWLSAGVIDTIYGLEEDPAPLDWTERLPDSSVRIRIGSPEYLLAMKAMTTRRSTVDLEDAAVLCIVLGIESEHEIAEIATRYWGSRSHGSQELFFEDIAERANALRDAGYSIPEDDSDRHPRVCGHWMPLARRRCMLQPGHAGQHR